MRVFNDSGHLIRLVGLYAVGTLSFFVLRSFTVPHSFGQYGHYRGNAIAEIAAPAVGTSSIVQVTTQVNCPWTAVSDADWITITAGSSGNGSGSFSWTVSPNSGNTDRAGNITVANQTLRVVDGISSGSPGQGSVTISGSEVSRTYNPCAPSHCSARAYESGTVSITVDGQVFTVDYGSSSDTSSSIALALASKINYPMSFLSASVSGSTITLTSTVDGAGTNYPLITSETYGPYCPTGVQCFTGPAFTATASGANLTGGTD
jgi:hypothetical protein